MDNQKKLCIKCNILKPLSEYTFRKDTKKYRNVCKECDSKRLKEWRAKNQDYIKQYRLDNQEQISAKQKEYYKKHAEDIKEYSKKYHNEHKEERNEKSKQYRIDNKEHIKEYNKTYSETHQEQILNKHREYFKNNKDTINKKRAKYLKDKLASDEFFKYREQVRRLVIKSFIRKGYKKNSKTYDIVGCDYETLLKHLKDTYKKNYGVEWDGKEKVHIDHIIPIATAKTDEDIKKLCHYTNLQLLKEKDNLAKRDKLDYKIKK